MCDSDSNASRACSVGTGVHLCDFITLHANVTEGGRQSERQEAENGRVQEMDKSGKRQEMV